MVGNGNIDNNRTFTGLTLDETHVLTPSMVLDVRANYFRFVQLTPGYTEQAQSITPASVGMTGMIHAPTVSQAVIPNINIAGFASPLFGSGSFSWSPSRDRNCENSLPTADWGVVKNTQNRSWMTLRATLPRQTGPLIKFMMVNCASSSRKLCRDEYGMDWNV